VKEEDRQRAIRLRLCRTAGDPEHPLPPISTGHAAIDEALGTGGLPRGQIVEFFGPSDCGKSTLALRIIAAVQRSGGTAALIDADRGFAATRAASLGVVLEKLILVQPGWTEQAVEIARSLAGSGAVDLVVVDSAAALVPRAELESSLESAGHGWQTAALTRGLRRVAAAARRGGACVLFLNQLRGRGDALPESSSGGPALKTYAALRVELRPLSGGRARLRVVRSRLGASFGAAEFGLG
jgi:recombination protein RecA